MNHRHRNGERDAPTAPASKTDFFNTIGQNRAFGSSFLRSKLLQAGLAKRAGHDLWDCRRMPLRRRVAFGAFAYPSISALIGKMTAVT
jgi:hypothetical protein